MEAIRQDLLAMADPGYAAFHRKLMPTVEAERVIGVRTPDLRAYAKKLFRQGSYEEFLKDLPHLYYEENNLHGMLIEQIRDCGLCLKELNRFLPYIDNWATCDLLRPKCFKMHRKELLQEIEVWLRSDLPYTIRFAMEMLMVHFLQEDFREEYLSWVASIDSNEYYVNMMTAWYFATALAHQYEPAVLYLENHKLSLWVHNKTIQKALESDRITKEQKEYLRTLKRK